MENQETTLENQDIAPEEEIDIEIPKFLDDLVVCVNMLDGTVEILAAYELFEMEQCIRTWQNSVKRRPGLDVKVCQRTFYDLTPQLLTAKNGKIVNNV